MNTKCSIIFFLLFCKIFFAQNDTALFKNQIKISPVRLVTDIRGISSSYERLFGNFSTQITSTYIFDPFASASYLNWRTYSNMHGFSFGLEEKYFFETDYNKNIFGASYYNKKYVSADFVFLNCDYELLYSFTRSLSDSIIDSYEDTVSIKRTTYAFGFKYGVQKCYKRFVFDFAIGVGFRYRNVNHSNQLYSNSKMVSPIEPVIPYIYNVPGNRFTFNIPMSLKIGYMF